MINLRQQSVNVDRLTLIEALKKGLAKHEAEYQEACKDYKQATVAFLDDAAARARAGDFKDLRLSLTAPVYKGDEYKDMIELLGESVDTTIQLDSEAYKAYYRNEWPWSRGFLESAVAYKTALGALGGALA